MVHVLLAAGLPEQSAAVMTDLWPKRPVLSPAAGPGLGTQSVGARPREQQDP